MTVSKRGKPIILAGNYQFSQHTVARSGRIRWRCMREFSGCKANIITYNDIVIKCNKVHNHQ